MISYTKQKRTLRRRKIIRRGKSASVNAKLLQGSYVRLDLEYAKWASLINAPAEVR